MEMVLGELRDAAFFAHGFDLDIVSLDAPFDKGQGFAWWSMPPSVRSFNATEYTGFDSSSAKVLEAIKAAHPPIDLVLGHSQGAILATALLALQSIPKHPRLGYVLNGGAWPNPYTSELESLSESSKDCRVLLVVGNNDKINPPAQQERVQKSLETAGCDVSVIRHDGGHAVPIKNGQAVERIMAWVAQGVASVSSQA